MPASLRSLASRLVLCVTALLALGACPCTPPPPPVVVDDPVVSQAVAALQRRAALVRDVAIDGEIVDGQGGPRQRFRYASLSSGAAAAELFDAASGARRRALVYDGQTLLVVDDEARAAQRPALPDEPLRRRRLLDDVFGPFAGDGWRPPSLVVAGGVPGALGAAGGDTWTLTIPIVDEVLNSQRLMFGTDGRFVKKELVDDRGVAVASTTVSDEWRDPSTGLIFPRRWRHTERGVTTEVTLGATAVNGGVEPTRFATSTPAGYAARDR